MGGIAKQKTLWEKSCFQLHRPRCILMTPQKQPDSTTATLPLVRAASFSLRWLPSQPIPWWFFFLLSASTPLNPKPYMMVSSCSHHSPSHPVKVSAWSPGSPTCHNQPAASQSVTLLHGSKDKTARYCGRSNSNNGAPGCLLLVGQPASSSYAQPS